MSTARAPVIFGLVAPLLWAGCSQGVDTSPDLPTQPASISAAERDALPRLAPANPPERPRLFIQVGIVTMSATPWELEENFQIGRASCRERV